MREDDDDAPLPFLHIATAMANVMKFLEIEKQQAEHRECDSDRGDACKETTEGDGQDVDAPLRERRP
jgi:hypothetical protein